MSLESESQRRIRLHLPKLRNNVFLRFQVGTFIAPLIRVGGSGLLTLTDDGIPLPLPSKLGFSHGH